MVTASAPLITLQSPKSVSLEEVSGELKKLWVRTPGGGEETALEGAIRASTFNLIVYEPAETQQLLAELGYYTGPVDGIDGPRTQAAIQVAQKQLGLPIDGRASVDLLNQLRSQLSKQRSHPGQLPLSSAMPYALDAVGAGAADEVASQAPCRVITLCPVSESTGGVKAQVSAYCPVQKKGEGSLICCEYITLIGTDAELTEVSGFIQSLMISELPKFLWWKALPDLDQDPFRRLATFCNLVFVDSSTFEDATTALAKIYDLQQQGIKVSDLNWRRLAAWQELTAEAFDPPPRHAALKEVDRFVLDYEAGSSAQALLFLGWLASRLKWWPVAAIHEGGDYDLWRIQFTNDDQRNIEAELAAIPVADPGQVVGDLIDLKLASTNLEADCCTVICSETRGCMRREAAGGAQSCWVQHVSPLSDQSPELLMSQQLKRWGQDRLFEESLALSAQILQMKA